MQAVARSGFRGPLRAADMLLVLAVAVIAAAVVVNGFQRAGRSERVQDDSQAFTRFVDSHVGPHRFGEPKVKLHTVFDTVCAKRRRLDYELCAPVLATGAQLLRPYELVTLPDGKHARQRISLGRAEPASEPPRSRGRD
jgi:hypothetical protein